MRNRPRIAGCAIGIACGLLSVAASAQDTATAGALFEKGVADMEAGHFASACPAIEESQRIDPRPGTLFTLAECEARWGKVASAAARYQEYVDLVSRLAAEQQARHKDRVNTARAQLGKLKPTVPTLTLVLSESAPPGTFVTRNGEVLKGAALGLPLPVDPGEYVIVTHVPGAPDRETRVSIALGDAKRVSLDALAVPATPVANVTAPLAPGVANAASSSTPDERRHSSSRRPAAYVAGSVGLAGVVVGSVSGLLVLGKKNTVKDNCVAGSCNDEGLSAANSGKTLATVSDVGFGVGIAGVAVAAILLLTGSSQEPSAEAAREPSPRWQPLLSGNGGLVSAGLLHTW